VPLGIYRRQRQIGAIMLAAPVLPARHATAIAAQEEHLHSQAPFRAVNMIAFLGINALSSAPMIRIDWNPVAHAGPVPITWYGLGWAAAFLPPTGCGRAFILCLLGSDAGRQLPNPVDALRGVGSCLPQEPTPRLDPRVRGSPNEIGPFQGAEVANVSGTFGKDDCHERNPFRSSGLPSRMGTLHRSVRYACVGSVRFHAQKL
jgi:hypothetical protein